MKIEIIYESLKDICISQYNETGKVSGISTNDLALKLGLQRSNVSRELSKLFLDNKIDKKAGKPVLYYVKDIDMSLKSEIGAFKRVIGSQESLKHQVSLAKAAIVYPPTGLHTLILGETGVGKSFFANCMYKYSLEVNRIQKDRFIVFNCADYANNPQLLISHLFGVIKGAYTGADESRDGIVEKASEGILFLDEVHRLHDEGQEMLFTLIDKGTYTPLGGTEERHIKLMIICATTENINSSLLKTFARRIPVVISLPTLKERGEDERLNIIKTFLEEESKRVEKNINIDEDALTALMSYDCKNNIGQLKSDIQIACAKAFLRNMTDGENLRLKLKDLNEEARSGLLKSKKTIPINWKIVNKNILDIDDITNLEDKYNVSQNIYDFIDKRNKELVENGCNDEDIKNKLIYEVEEFINIFLKNVNSKKDHNEIKNLVNEDLYEMLENFMVLAEYKLKKTISKNIFLGLLIHINIFMNRIEKRKRSMNPKIDEIRKKYPVEFKLAMKLAYKIEEKFDIDVPIGEIGFITMFFAGDKIKQKGKVAVIVAMHGDSTASSMAEVANSLLGVHNVRSYDMQLSVKPKDALDDIEELVRNLDEKMGVLMVVDMGSLCYFDKILEQRTGIRVRTINMASTATVIEASRKALKGCSLDEIVQSIKNEEKYLSKIFNNQVDNSKEVIISACLTGEGTAIKLIDILKDKYGIDKYEYINLSIEDRENFAIVVRNLQKTNKIKCIVSAFNPQIEGIEYMSIQELFNQSNDSVINTPNNSDMVIKIKNIYSEYLNLEESDYIVDSFIEVLDYLKHYYNLDFDNEKFNGLMMHYGSLVEKLINKEVTSSCNKNDYIINRYEDIVTNLKEKLKVIEKKLKIEFKDSDICNLVEIIFEL